MAVANELVGIIAALASAASWAVGAILLKPYAEQLPAMGLAFVKGTLGLFVLGTTILALGPHEIGWRTFWTLLFSGALGIGVADSLFFRALRELSSHSVVQLMLLGQVVTIALAVLFLGESLRIPQWIGVALVVAGVWVVLSDRNPDQKNSGSRRGILYGLVSVLAMAVSVTMAKDVLDSVDALSATFIRIAGGVVAIFLIASALGRAGGEWWRPLVADWRVTARFCAIAIFVTFGGFFLSLLALKYAQLAIANTLLSTEPLFVLLIAALSFGERPEPRRLLGSLVSVAGVGFISSNTLSM